MAISVKVKIPHNSTISFYEKGNYLVAISLHTESQIYKYKGSSALQIEKVWGKLSTVSKSLAKLWWNPSRKFINVF